MGRKGKGGGDKEPELLDRSCWWYGNPNPQAARDTFELLDVCVLALHDWCAIAREVTMTVLVGALEKLPPLDEIDSRCFTIFAFCGISIKKGSPREARLAYRAVGLLALTLRAGSPWILAESSSQLSRKLKAQVSHDDAPTLVAALDCLAAVTFAGAQDMEDVERSLKVIWDVVVRQLPISSKIARGASATKTSPKVLAAAVSTWAFLVTTINPVTNAPRKAGRNAWDATIANLAGLLENDDRTVRMAAGEAIAVCVEHNLTQQNTQRKDMEAPAAKASELADEAAGRGSNNTLLPEQKYLFRQIAAFLDRDERPKELVAVRRALSERCVALKVSTWAKLAQLNFLSSFLGNGFLKHAHGNELFKEAFSYGADKGKVLSIAKKKQCCKTKEEVSMVKRDRLWECGHIKATYPYTVRDYPEKLLEVDRLALN